MKTPLTEEEKALAEREADMIKIYVGSRRLPQVDFYDLAAEGFLQAAQAYTTRKELQDKCSFKTVARMRMMSKIGGHFKTERRRREIAPTVRLEPDVGRECPMLHALESKETYAMLCESISQVLTPRQSALIRQLADGATERELGRKHGMTIAQVRQELADARAALAPHKEELYAIAA